MTLLEVCVDGVESALAAQHGGADRVELCATLDVGGVTPSAGLLQTCIAATHLPVQVMVRPRGGDFVYSDPELDAMRRDIAMAGEARADGIVLGVLTPDGNVDAACVQDLVQRARPMSVTFHRAFDMAQDQLAAWETLAEIGVDRVLTSGGRSRAIDATDRLRSLVEAGGPNVIAAAGIEAGHARELVTATGITELHVGSACRARHDSPMSFRNEALQMGTDATADEFALWRTDAELVRQLVAALA